MNFVSRDDDGGWTAFLRARGLSTDLADGAVMARLLPVYRDGAASVIWEADIAGVPVEWTPVAPPGQLSLFSPDPAGGGEGGWHRLRFQNGVSVVLPPGSDGRVLAGLNPALRTIALMRPIASSCRTQIDVPWVGGSIVSVPDASLVPLVRAIGTRMRNVAFDRTSELTKSAYYMGSKFALASFLVEGIAGVLPEGGVVIDLMCGSGSAARAFGQCWEVVAADAMLFCTTLAGSVGHRRAGMNSTEVLSTVLPAYHRNLETLEGAYADLLQEEDSILHSAAGFDEGLAEQYGNFVERTPRFPEGGRVGSWTPVDEVLTRRTGGRGAVPYCLMTAYFGNVYFGLRQAIELDSLRFAIEGIANEDTRASALAAVVATASYLGTGYASQFAQPVNVRGLSRRVFLALMERRSIRVLPEFTARMTALAEIAEAAPYPIQPFTGTWQATLNEARRFARGRPACVYVDAPYTRDEYARYYHVLETLCRYHYPDSVGRGRVPARKDEQIFRSPFFTRRDESIAPLLSSIILRALKEVSYCAWSYSSRARASIPEVVRRVVSGGGELVRSHSVGHRYNGQGRTDRRSESLVDVDEYLLVFQRADLR
jgi:adenine-specific DNA-methyltransferase